MYIAQIQITNFRGFSNTTTIDFHEGFNVIIGPNNSGKSNLIKALSLLFDSKDKKLNIDDFNKNINIKAPPSDPPQIRISAIIKESEKENPYSDDLACVATWLTKLEPPYEAQLTYEFYLPQNECDKYTNLIAAATFKTNADFWRIIKKEFIHKYTYKMYVGNPDYKIVADSDSLRKFDFQFLTAIRDVERDLFSGGNNLLKEVIDFFMDYEIKTSTTQSQEEKTAAIKEKKESFNTQADNLIQNLHTRMEFGKKQMLNYANATGASFGNIKPDFEGNIIDSELYSALKLIVEHETGIKLPATHNGLGYNNLIFISLLLAKMQKNASAEYLGDNSKIFPILAIEEPEAHLHPAMQYKFLKFLRENKKTDVRQIFITTHSPNITAAVDLDEIITVTSEKQTVTTSCPGKTFKNDRYKAHVTRFLDATKADMLFASRIILVEGLAEQLLIPILAKQLNKDLADKHISVINLGGRHFEPFLEMFNITNDGIDKKIACLADPDPQRQLKTESRFKSCFPFELGDKDKDEQYNFKQASNSLVDYTASENIKIYHPAKGKGKTFEYELIISNPSNLLFITESIRNSDELKQLMTCLEKGQSVPELLAILNDEKIKKSIENNTTFTDEEKKKHIIAARYLNSINEKGLNALEICHKLQQPNSATIEIPSYIKEAIEWICE